MDRANGRQKRLLRIRFATEAFLLIILSNVFLEIEEEKHVFHRYTIEISQLYNSNFLEDNL